MTDSHEGCLDRTASDKEAGAVVYLMEELGDARMRCDQLIRGLNEGLKLIENSSHKDHFFEVAGHLIQSVPVLAFKLQKALEAVALAAGRIDYEELKRSLRPEKVQELEKVLEDVRIRQVQRMSPLQQLTPKHAANALRKVAWMARGDSGLPQYEVSRLILALEEGLGVDGPEDISEGLEKLAEALEEAEGPNRVLVASTLRRMLGDAGVEDFHKTEKRMQTKNAYAFAGKLSEEVLQMAEEKDVRKKFKAENPDITEADMKKIVEMWKEHKDTLKAAAWKAPVVAGAPSNPDMARLWRHLNDISSDASGLVRHASGDVAQGLKEIAAQAQKAMDLVTKHDKSMKSASDEDKKSRFEEGKPADPTKNMSPEDKAKWEASNEKHKDKFKKDAWKAPSASDEDKKSRFEEGKPADPTKNMSPEDKKKWEESNEKHKDKFKSASWKVEAGRPGWLYTKGLKSAFIAWEQGKHYEALEAMADNFENLGRSESPPFDPDDVRKGKQLAKRIRPLSRELHQVMMDGDNLLYGLEETVEMAAKTASDPWKA